MGIERVGHIVIKMRDLEVAKQFYGGILGMKISSESPRGIFFRFGDYHHDIAVFKVTEQADPPKEDQVGLLHMALVVDSVGTLKQLNTKLKEEGVTIMGALDHGMTKSLYIRDPDGNAIELYAEVPGYDWRTNDDFIGDVKRIDIDELPVG